MFITNHVLAGAAVGHVFRRPVVALVAGAASHIVMDVCLHYGREDMSWSELVRIGKVDGVLGLGVCAAAVASAGGPARRSVVAGIVGACLIDMDKPGRHFLGRSPFPAAVDRFHHRIQSEHEAGALVEAATAAGLAAALLAAARHDRYR